MIVSDPEEHELRALLTRFPAACPVRVVEIGCGDGRLTHRYAAHAESVLAIDPDAALTAAFRASGVEPNVDLRTIPVDQLKISDGAVDVVLFSWAL
jgi:16S rRNA A1518/A1519 N6-dimethyltransferase RsmA/KsgA/DIM1 with predicted DNA glycosylase/AP lyase activity